MKPLKSCSHIALGWEEAKNSSFSRLHLVLHDILWEHILRKATCEAVLPNNFTKTAIAPPIELFTELKHKKTASLMKWSCAKRGRTLDVVELFFVLFEDEIEWFSSNKFCILNETKYDSKNFDILLFHYSKVVGILHFEFYGKLNIL